MKRWMGRHHLRRSKGLRKAVWAPRVRLRCPQIALWHRRRAMHLHCQQVGGRGGSRLVSTSVAMAYDGIDMARVQYCRCICRCGCRVHCRCCCCGRHNLEKRTKTNTRTSKDTCSSRCIAVVGVATKVGCPGDVCDRGGACVHADGGGQPSGSPQSGRPRAWAGGSVAV
jgi:hypothetical protein